MGVGASAQTTVRGSLHGITKHARSPGIILAVAWLALVTVYLLLAPGNRSEAEDAFWFAHDVETAPQVRLMSGEHVRHLLYLPLARTVVHAVRQIADVGAHGVLVVLSAAAAALTVVLFVVLVRRRLSVSRRAAVAAASGLAVSYGFWRYGVEAEAYALASLALVASLLVGLSDDRPVLAAVGGAALGVLGSLLHFSLIIPTALVIPVALLLRRRFIPVLAYVATVAVLLTGSLYATYRYVDPGIGFVAYVTTSAGSGTSEAALEPSSLPKGAAGFTQAVLSGAFVFGYAPAVDRLEAALPDKNLSEERYLGERLPPLARLVPPLTLAALLVVMVALLRALRHRREPDVDVSRRRPVVIGVLVWGAVSTLGLLMTSPAAPEAWTLQLPVLWLLLALTFDRLDGGASRWLPAALVGLIAIHNVFGGVVPHRARASDLNAVKASWLVQNADPSDLIVTAGGPVFFRYLQYHTAAEVVYLPDPASEDTPPPQAAMASAAGAVYVTGDVLDPPRTLEGADLERVAKFAAEVRGRLDPVVGDAFGGIYRLESAP